MDVEPTVVSNKEMEVSRVYEKVYMEVDGVSVTEANVSSFLEVTMA